MTHPSKLTLVALALSISALMSAATASAATAPPKVAFVGDFLTDGWSTSFPANWTDYDVSGGQPAPSQIAAAIAAKPSIIHVMLGSSYWDDDASYNLVTAELEENLITDITQAQAAGIPVIVGLEPLQYTGYFAVSQEDLIVYAVATKYGVPIINYSGAFSNAQTGYGGVANGSGGTAFGFDGEYLNPNSSFFTPSEGSDGNSVNVPNAAGYAIMTMMAQTAFATLSAQPKSLYLQDTLIQGNECSGCNGVPNVNTASPGNIVQFYPVISYTNGVSGVGFNTNFMTGTNGTWTSSNPLVGIVNQYGEFWAINEGQTTVKFTLPNGVWNEWIMYVGAPFPG
jgi:hypothetical protein